MIALNKRYKRWVQVFILLAIFIVGGITLADNLFSEDTIPKEGSKAPEFTLPGLMVSNINCQTIRAKSL